VDYSSISRPCPPAGTWVTDIRAIRWEVRENEWKECVSPRVPTVKESSMVEMELWKAQGSVFSFPPRIKGSKCC
jgi:hypothetical protein